MRIAINGIGVAGPTLAWWLRRFGHEPVLFEKSPTLRTGGYMIDFWGVGYDVADKMGLIPDLRGRGYVVESLQFYNSRGKRFAELEVGALRPLFGDRLFSIPRGEIAAQIYHACECVEAHFGESLVKIKQDANGVDVVTSLGRRDRFDLVVGADGLHSAVRSMVFGAESDFEKRLGIYVAAFALQGYQPRDELTYVSHTVPHRQVARVALRNDQTMFLFIWLADSNVEDTAINADPKGVLRRVFGDMEWEVPRILAQLDNAQDIYMDYVSQIQMPHWTHNRVALVGDAAACVSFLAGEGTGLAMTEAYVLAGEIHRAGQDFATAFLRYEERLQSLLKLKQKGALSFASFFAPKSNWRLVLRNLAMRASSLPFLARWFIGRTLRDDFVLPEYT